MTKAEKKYNELKSSAKKITDKENTILYISDTISLYIVKRILEMIREELKGLIQDKEIGVITEAQLKEEASVLRVVYKSLQSANLW